MKRPAQKFNSEPITNKTDKEQPTIVIVMPYFGKPSLILMKKLKTIFRKFEIDVGFGFKVKKLLSYFKIKDSTPDLLMSKVIYQFQCPCDEDQSYIGKTKRHLNVRIREHITIPNSAIYNHSSSCHCKPSADNFKILSKGNSEFEINIKEALLIKQLTPKLNTKLANDGSSYFLKIF